MKQKRIVLVDDEGLVLMGLEEVLLMNDYLVEPFMSPEDAISYCEKSPASVDMLVTDQSMPGMSGLELIQRFRQINPGAPTILFTGHMNLGDKDMKSEHGIGKVLIKPFDPELLLESVSELLQGE